MHLHELVNGRVGHRLMSNIQRRHRTSVDCELLTCGEAEVTIRRSVETIIRDVVIVWVKRRRRENCRAASVSRRWPATTSSTQVLSAATSLARPGPPPPADSPFRRITDLHQRPTASSVLAAQALYVHGQTDHPRSRQSRDPCSSARPTSSGSYQPRMVINALMDTSNYNATSNLTWSWYTGRWWVGCYTWYSEEGHGLTASRQIPSSLYQNPAHPSKACVPITCIAV